MDVHARGIVLEQWLGHERRGHAVFARDILHHVFVDHQIVGHARQRGETHVDFGLAGRRDLMVMSLDSGSPALQGQHHLGAEVLHAVDRGNREIPFFLARLVAEVRRLLLCLSSSCPPPNRFHGRRS